MTKFTIPAWAYRVTCLAFCLAASTGASAQHVLFKGPAGQVSSVDVQADAATRISDTARSTILSRPESVQQLASNVYVQRAMAAEAQREGLMNGPIAEAILVLAREKAMADLYWADFDKRHQPTEAALDAYAQTVYRGDAGKQFDAPERTRVRHILLTDKTPESRARIEKLLAQAKAGADFSQLARDNSEDKGSAAKGGDIGFVEDGAVVEPFEKAMKTLKVPGDLSGVVETQYGYHIIRLEEHREAGKRPYAEVREQLLMQTRAALAREARAKEIQRMLEGTTPENAAIKTFSSQFTPVEAR